MAKKLRPHTKPAHWRDSVHVCEFCEEECADQTLVSWDYCCPEFELTLEVEQLRAFINFLDIETMHPDMGGYHQCRVKANYKNLQPHQWRIVDECRFGADHG